MRMKYLLFAIVACVIVVAGCFIAIVITGNAPNNVKQDMTIILSAIAPTVAALTAAFLSSSNSKDIDAKINETLKRQNETLDTQDTIHTKIDRVDRTVNHVDTVPPKPEQISHKNGKGGSTTP